MIWSEYIFRKNEQRRDAIFCYLDVKSKLGSVAWQRFCTVSFKKQGLASYFCFHLECRDYTWEFYFSYYNFDLKSYLILMVKTEKNLCYNFISLLPKSNLEFFYKTSHFWWYYFFSSSILIGWRWNSKRSLSVVWIWSID